MRRMLGLCLVLGMAVTASGRAQETAGEALPARALTLRECVSIALEKSPRLEAAKHNAEGAEASLRRSYSSYLPQALITTQHGRSGGVSLLDTAAGTIPLSTSALRHEADMVLSQTFWQSGRRHLLEQARASYHASQGNEEATRQGVIQSVAQAYYEALATQSLVEVTKAALKGAEDRAEMVKARAEVGMGARVDIVPAEADVAEAELELIQAENNAKLSRARLKNEMGVAPTYSISLADSFAPGKSALPGLEEALSVAYEKRPEVASGKASLQASLRGLALAKSREGPVISVGGQYDEGLSGSGRRTAWNFTASAQVFVFDGGARKSDVEASKASLRGAEAQQQELVNGIGLEVETARLAVETANKSIEAAGKSLERAQAQLAAAEGKYREGVGIYLEVTDAQSALTRAEINRVQAILDHQKALVSYQRALGTLDLESLPVGEGQQ